MFIAYVMFPGNDINMIRTLDTEAEADAFSRKQSTYMIDPKGEYDPPVVLLFEADSLNAADANKFKRSVAIYQRGNRFNCMPEKPETVSGQDDPTGFDLSGQLASATA